MADTQKKLEMSIDDTEAAENALDDYAAWVKESKRNRPKGHPDTFFAGFYYGLAHGRGEKPTAPPPPAPEDGPKIPE